MLKSEKHKNNQFQQKKRIQIYQREKMIIFKKL